MNFKFSEGMTPTEFAVFACELASHARLETLTRFDLGDEVENKGGDAAFDTVTEADRAAELAMRSLIAERFPEHGISGEEFPDKTPSGRHEWSLDPIDGTRSFICGLPSWTTLIALLEDGQPVLGLIDAPVLGETYLGSGEAAWLSRHGGQATIRTSGCRKLPETRLSTTDPFLFEVENETFAAFDRVRGACRVTRYGHDGYAYARLAAGSLDLIMECALKPHDYNAVVPLVRAAGGHVGNWAGGTDLSGGAVIAAATRELYDAVVELIAAE